MNFSALIATAFASLAAIFPPGAFGAVPSALSEPRAHVYFVGDMMFDRSIRNATDHYGEDYVFSCIDPTLAGADLIAGNLEGPITDSGSVSLGSAVGSPANYVFTFPRGTAALLAAHGVRMVNLGNNHISNFGSAGVRSTMRALDAADVQYFGDPLAQTVATTSVNGIPLAFINYNQFSPSSSASTTIAQVIAARGRGEIAIVYTHWGDEYAPATDLEKALAHRFADAGAALIVGSHPHVVQESERRGAAHIYYSLGNFIFDQYWDESVRRGLMLDVTLDAGGVADVREIPVELTRDRRTCAMPAAQEE